MDDSSFMQFVIEKVLKKIDYHYEMASDAYEAIQILKELDMLPDLILCDVVMPGLNGFEFKQNISKNPDWASIPIIFLSAKEDVQSTKDKFLNGKSIFLNKPFKEEDLIISIKHALR